MSAEPVEVTAVHASAAVAVPVASSRTVGPYERFVKPLVDRIVAAVSVVVLLPVMLAVAVVVLAEFGRPLLFCQQRVGQGGRVFTVFKFRTMRHDRRRSHAAQHVEAERRRTHKSDDDPRHTRVGRVLRRLSLDELPQLWNVLRGDMSLVGPRPELVYIVERYAPWQQRRHEVKPGLTGLWQVSARGGAPMHEVTHIDIAYVDALSLRTDLRILASTPGAVFLKRSGS